MDFIVHSLGDPSVWVPSLVCVAAICSYLYYENTYRYWEKRGVKGERPWPLVSEMYELFFRDRGALILERTRKHGKIHGIFTIFKPRLVVADAEVIRQIAIKDFDAFQDHKVNQWANQFQKNFLVWLPGDQWKRSRTMMTPTFTSGKIKRMFKLMDLCADDLVDNFRENLDKFNRLKLAEQQAKNTSSKARQLGQEDCIVDLYEVYSMYTLDGITTCCYGIRLKREGDSSSSLSSRRKSASSRNSLLEDCQRVSGVNWSRIFYLLFLPTSVLKFIGFKMTPESKAKPLVDRIEKMIQIRRDPSSRNKYDDLLQLLVDARLDDKLELTELDAAENHHAELSHDSLIKDHEESKRSTLLREKANNDSTTIRQAIKSTNQMSDIEILSEALFLLVAGLDTTRTSLSTITYLLAHNQHVQDKLYEELKAIAVYEDNQVGRHLKFDYDSLTSCHYLDAVISESLRFMTPAPYTDRQVGRDYRIEKYNIELKKGEQILLGFHSVHHDPDYWDKPEEFKPERFLPGKEGRDRIVPGSYAPFGLGPRHCIGMRFSLTETKLGLAKVLINLKFEPAPGTEYPPTTPRGLQTLSRVRNCKVIVKSREDN